VYGNILILSQVPMDTLLPTMS